MVVFDAEFPAIRVLDFRPGRSPANGKQARLGCHHRAL